MKAKKTELEDTEDLDDIYEMYKDFDFAMAKPASENTALQQLRAEASKGKQRVNIYLDNAIIDAFRERAAATGKGYQTLINETLRAAVVTGQTPLTAELLRQILHEELQTKHPA